MRKETLFLDRSVERSIRVVCWAVSKSTGRTDRVPVTPAQIVADSFRFENELCRAVLRRSAPTGTTIVNRLSSKPMGKQIN